MPRYAIQLPDGRRIQDADWRSPGDVMRSSHGHGFAQMPGELVTVPVRIQRLRTPGWRMPSGTIYVGRPTPWGNPFPVSDVFSREDAVLMYRELVLDGVTWWGSEGDRHRFTRKPSGPLHVPTVAEIRRLLAGKDLACWCPTDEPCHADVLLDLGNR